MKDTDMILSWLEDEESKFIYKKKLEFNKTGNYDAIGEIVDAYVPQFKNKKYYVGIEQRFIEKLAHKKNIVVFGAGINGKRLLELFDNESIPVFLIMIVRGGEGYAMGML